MAERPIFVPRSYGPALVQEVLVSFHWHAGMAPSQKRKNILEMHAAAERRGFSPLLEVSSKSELEAGRRLSAFHMPLRVNGITTTVECAFQGGKVFENGGPYIDLYEVTSREAKRDERLKSSGRLVAFSFEGEEFSLYPPTAFYDWLYLNALYPYRDWLRRLDQFAGFTDIEFNPERSINCQARSCAKFAALDQRNLLDDAVESYGSFLTIGEGENLSTSGIIQN